MSDAVWQTVVGGIVAIVLAWMSHRAKAAADKAAQETKRVGEQVEEVHKSTNSMKDALVAAALLRGASEERERAAAEKKQN